MIKFIYDDSDAYEDNISRVRIETTILEDEETISECFRRFLQFLSGCSYGHEQIAKELKEIAEYLEDSDISDIMYC